MEATAMTVVSQLITDARSRFGAFNVEVLEIDGELLDETMDQVLAIGGQVSLDGCVVEGVLVRERPADAEVPVVHLRDSEEPQPLTPLEGE
jgi:glycine cleavage system protein P-like pyridoxal-binding family